MVQTVNQIVHRVTGRRNLQDETPWLQIVPKYEKYPNRPRPPAVGVVRSSPRIGNAPRK